jgi:hypothetical protein
MGILDNFKKYLNGEVISKRTPFNGAGISEIELDEDLGEIVCPICGGRGAIELARKDGSICRNISICPKCWGKRKLDWIEQATGVEPPDYNGSSGYMGTSGTSGCVGPSGVSGSIGFAGISGTSGAATSPYSKGMTELGRVGGI